MVDLSYDEVFDRVRSLSELATLTNSLTAILSITQDPSGTAKDLGTVISKDPALSMKLLKTVNSCFFGFERSIETIEDAVVLLGFAEVERLSMAVSVINHFGARTKRAKALNQLWIHCLVCGIAAETLVEVYQVKKIEPGQVYIAALLHDIGKAVLWQGFPEVMPEILSVMEEKNGTVHEAEREMLGGASHCEIGAWAAEQWSLPLSTIETIQLHHSPQEFPKDNPLPKVVHMADALCYHVRVPAQRLPGDAPQAGPPSYKFLHDNDTLLTRFRERYEAKRATIESLTG